MPQLVKGKSASQWIEGRHRIDTSKGPMFVDGAAFGRVFVHPSRAGDPVDGWNVTHLGTGLRIVTVRELDDAMRVAEVLEPLPGMDQSRKELALAKLPGWVKPWVQVLVTAGKFVKPERDMR